SLREAAATEPVSTTAKNMVNGFDTAHEIISKYESQCYIISPFLPKTKCTTFTERKRKESIMTKPDPVFPADRHALYDAHGYSAAIRSGDLLFVSGQVGSRVDGSPEPDFGEQVRLAFANLKATLKAGGCSYDD